MNRDQPKKFNTPTISLIEDQIKQYKHNIDTLKKRKHRLFSKKKIRCIPNVHGVGCGKMCEVGKMTYITSTSDVYECGVGYDVQSNTNEYGFRCTYCGHLNRVFRNDEPYQFFLGKYFKDYTTEHIT